MYLVPLTLSLPCVSTSSQHQCVLQGTMSVDQGSTAIIAKAKTKRPEKDIKVSAKVLRKCFVSSLILLWKPKSAQSALSSTVFKI